jgi:hypothetical protein
LFPLLLATRAPGRNSPASIGKNARGAITSKLFRQHCAAPLRSDESPRPRDDALSRNGDNVRGQPDRIAAKASKQGTAALVSSVRRGNLAGDDGFGAKGGRPDRRLFDYRDLPETYSQLPKTMNGVILGRYPEHGERKKTNT